MFNTDLLHNLYDTLKNSTTPESLFKAAYSRNEWFDRTNIEESLAAIIDELLLPENVAEFVSKYNYTDCTKRSVTIVMAGNIPFVGCADLLYALLCDYGRIYIKLSSKDYVTMSYLIEKIEECQGYRDNIKIYNGESCDKLIATGSDNSGRYFRHTFKAQQALIRANRSSVAVVKDGASDSEIDALWDDIFLRYGLGCRNITKIFVPRSFDISRFNSVWRERKIDSKHYDNIYRQQRALLTLMSCEFIDLGYALLVENDSLFSQLSVVNYCFYDNLSEVYDYLKQNENQLQCQLFSDQNFGKAQFPSLFDYADGVDVMKFLLSK